MGDLRERLAGLFSGAMDAGAMGCRQAGDYPDAALDLIAEECAGLAVVRTLASMTTTIQPHEWVGWAIPVPIAPAPPSLLEQVARMLLERNPWTGDDWLWPSDDPPPFAAAYADTPSGRQYVLASSACERCGGKGKIGKVVAMEPSFGLVKPSCPDCNGTGARADVGAIARRYGGDGDARLARFEVGRNG